MSDQRRNFAAGTFIRAIDGQFGEFFSIAIKPKEFSKWLNTLKTSPPKEGFEEGFANLTLMKSRSGNWTLFEDTYEPKGKGGVVKSSSGGQEFEQDETLPF